MESRSRGIWMDLVAIAEQARPHTLAVWQWHRALYREWQSMPLRAQAAEIREYLSSHTTVSSDWSHLIPAGEAPESEELFLTDLRSLFRVLTAPVDQRTQGVRKRRSHFTDLETET